MKLTFGGKPITLLGDEVKVGDKARNFRAVNNDLSSFELSSLDGNKVKVISIAPSLDTSVCSLQTIRFNEEAGKLKDNVDLVTISVDLPFAQRRYCAAEGIENMTVVSDYQGHDFGRKYGFLIDGLLLLARGVVVIDRGDVVRYVEYVSEGTNHPDYDKALEAINELI